MLQHSPPDPSTSENFSFMGRILFSLRTLSVRFACVSLSVLAVHVRLCIFTGVMLL